MKDLLTTSFGVPSNHRKTRPYLDHVMHFAWSDDRIWVRNYQICDERQIDALESTSPSLEGLSLSEIGPRFILHPVAIREGSFGGRCLWRNPHYVPLGQLRNANKMGEALRHRQRTLDHNASKQRKEESVLPDDDLDHVFD